VVGAVVSFFDLLDFWIRQWLGFGSTGDVGMNGWMNRQERRVKQFISQLLHDRARVISVLFLR